MRPDLSAPRRLRWGPAAALLVLSPVCAEYLVGYDDSTGDPGALLAGLIVFVPLYGAPALLIRELSRRLEMGRPGILALACAAGVAQAGIIDQSMFSLDYRDIDYWAALIEPTWIAPLGTSATTTIGFVAGHTLMSFGAPIAMVESFAPGRRPWLRLPGLIATVGLYLAGAAVVLRWHLTTESDHASTAQLAGAASVALLLIVLAVVLGRRRPRRGDGPVPAPILVGTASLALTFAYQLMPPTWLGVAGTLAILAGAALAVGRLARSRRWTGAHIAMLATGALASSALVGFFSAPIGDVDPVARYAHNVFFLVGAIVLGLLAARSAGRRETREEPAGSTAVA
ncbi:hypothetical protein AB0I28_01830 [Phytomonospora sp. NPDC050363]|uniref:hypothetical protein n=1 Tax=Phytomonospora sp. NPDC050363 TaxID=3155642 RepID=UPI0033DF7A84